MAQGGQRRPENFNGIRDISGWEGRDFPGGNERYVIFNTKSKGVGGVMALPDGIDPAVLDGYVGTADIDSAVANDLMLYQSA